MGQWGMNPGFFGFAGGRSSIPRGGNLHQPTCPSHPSHPLPQPPQPPTFPGRPAAQPFQLPFLPSGASLVFLLLFTYAGFTGLYVSVGLLVYMYRWVYWSTFFLGLFKLWLYSRLPLYISCGGFLLLLLVALPFLLTTLEHFSFFTYYSGLFLFYLLLTAFFLLLLWAFSFFYLRLFKKFSLLLLTAFSLLLLPAYFHSASSLLPIYYRCTSNVLPLNY